MMDDDHNEQQEIVTINKKQRKQNVYDLRCEHPECKCELKFSYHQLRKAHYNSVG